MEEFFRECKTFNFERATVSKQLSKAPAFLFSAHLTSGGGGAGTGTLYDGHTTNGNAKVDLSAPVNSSDPRTFIPPIYFDQGIYFGAGSNVTSIIVTIRRVRDLARDGKKRSLRSLLPSWLGGYSLEE